jgi:hypothetical protein
MIQYDYEEPSLRDQFNINAALSKKNSVVIFKDSLHDLKSVQFAGFIRIPKIKTPPPIPETGPYDLYICSPF